MRVDVESDTRVAVAESLLSNLHRDTKTTTIFWNRFSSSLLDEMLTTTTPNRQLGRYFFLFHYSPRKLVPCRTASCEEPLRRRGRICFPRFRQDHLEGVTFGGVQRGDALNREKTVRVRSFVKTQIDSY